KALPMQFRLYYIVRLSRCGFLTLLPLVYSRVVIAGGGLRPVLRQLRSGGTRFRASWTCRSTPLRGDKFAMAIGPAGDWGQSPLPTGFQGGAIHRIARPYAASSDSPTRPRYKSS